MANKTLQEPTRVPRRLQEASKTRLPFALVGSWPPRGPKSPPRRPKTPPRGPQDGPRCPQDAPRWPKMGAKIEPKSIKKGVQHGKASWHRFLIDSGGFWEPSWGRKSSKNRSKKSIEKVNVLKSRKIKKIQII